MKYIKPYESYKNFEIDKIISELTDKEKNFLKEFSQPILRKLMSNNQIKMANMLVKKGVLEKGTSDDKKHSIHYYTDYYVINRI